MNIFWLSVIFFGVGVTEFFIDQLEKLVSVRLKIMPTLFYSVINNLIDIVMYLFMFDILYQWRTGTHDYYKLIPLLAYTFGKISGTILALRHYSAQKKKRDHEKAVHMLSKSKKKSKKPRTKRQKEVDKAIQTATTEILLDPVEVEDIKSEAKERAIAQATEKIVQKVDEAFNESN